MPKQVRDRSANQRRLRIEHLEDRRLLAVLTVQNDRDDTIANLAGDGELSLREAIEIANNPGTVIDGFVSNDVEDTIEFARPFFDQPRTIFLEDGELEISETLTIDGPGQELLAIDAQRQSRVLNYSAVSGDLNLSTITLQNGRTASDNSPPATTYSGGGIRFNSAGALNVLHGTLLGNETHGEYASGGGVFARAGSVTLSNTTVAENRTSGPFAFGGAIFTVGGTLSFVDSVVTGNGTLGDFAYGGAIYNGSGLVSVTGSTLSGNYTEGERSRGAGIYTFSGALHVTDSIISSNRTAGIAALGGGIGVGAGSLNLANSSVSGNTTAGEDATGAGISVGQGSLYAEGSEISKNRTMGPFADGGGIYLSSGTATLLSSTVSGNSTEGSFTRGGGFHTRNGQLSMFGSTVTDNLTVDAGGGIFIDNPPLFGDQPLTVVDSLVANNSDSGIAPNLMVDPDGPLVISYSIISNTAGSGIDATTGVGNLLNVDPLLGPLADNGGPTQTHALLPGSPALEAGDPSIVFDPGEFDQRGAPFHRVATGMLSGIPQQRIDIGAYEAQTPPSADFVDDDHVNGQDFLAWQIGFGITENATRADGDSDGDGDVDLSDLAAWRVSYGQTEAPPPPLGAIGQGAVASDPIAASLVDAVLGVMGSENEEQVVVVADQAYVEVLPEDHGDTFSPILAAQVESAESPIDSSDAQLALFAELAEDLFGWGL